MDKKYLLVTNGIKPQARFPSELPHQVTHVESLGNVYSATSNDKSESKETATKRLQLGFLIGNKRLDGQQRTYVSPVSFDEAAKNSRVEK